MTGRRYKMVKKKKEKKEKVCGERKRGYAMISRGDTQDFTDQKYMQRQRRTRHRLTVPFSRRSPGTSAATAICYRPTHHDKRRKQLAVVTLPPGVGSNAVGGEYWRSYESRREKRRMDKRKKWRKCTLRAWSNTRWYSQSCIDRKSNEQNEKENFAHLY